MSTCSLTYRRSPSMSSNFVGRSNTCAALPWRKLAVGLKKLAVGLKKLAVGLPVWCFLASPCPPVEWDLLLPVAEECVGRWVCMPWSRGRLELG